MEAVLSIIAGIVGIFWTILRIYQADKNNKPVVNPYDKEHEERTKKFDEALVKHDDNTLSAMLNELRVPDQK